MPRYIFEYKAAVTITAPNEDAAWQRLADNNDYDTAELVSVHE